MNSLTDCIVLNNGVEIPCVGFGTWKITNDDTYSAVLRAFEAGYRHIDTAHLYGNEQSVGKAFADSGLKREDVFITSKLWNTSQGYATTLQAFEKTMENLKLDYLDLYLIHWPVPAIHKHDWQISICETWRAFEKLYAEKKIRAIGVSNFLPHHLDCLLSSANIIPAIDQIEVHPGHNREETVDYCKAKGIAVEAWSPLARGKLMDNELLLKIADAHSKTVAQVCLRWSLQRGLIPLPKSVTLERIAENAKIFDFKLSSSEMDLISKIPPFTKSHDPDNIDF